MYPSGTHISLYFDGAQEIATIEVIGRYWVGSGIARPRLSSERFFSLKQFRASLERVWYCMQIRSVQFLEGVNSSANC